MQKLFLLDASGYLYRSYHAIQGMTNARGESTNALFGFIRSVQKLVKDFSPQHLVSIFDGPRSIEKREAIYSAYKANRKQMPGDLRYQIQWAKDYCRLMGIALLSVEGVEADDTLGSVAKWAESQGCAVYMCTSDKDMAQLVTDKVRLLNTFKENQILGPQEVEQVYGVPPKLMVDWLSMTGDASDNVPGLPGFGPKTATTLLQQFGSLDAILSQPSKLAGKKRETVESEGANALLSRQLVTIDTAVDFPRDRVFFQIASPEISGLREFYKDKNFISLLRELDDASQQENAAVALPTKYHLVDDESSLQQLVDILKKQKQICLDTETTGTRPLRAALVGIGLGISMGEAWYIPVNGALGFQKVYNALRPLLEDSKIGFYGHNIKYDMQVLASAGIVIANACFDTLLASYILNSHQRRHSLDDLSLELFQKKKINIEELIGKRATSNYNG